MNTKSIGNAGAQERHDSESSATRTSVATFGAGCFWGVEETFRVLEGVLSTLVGYAGGQTTNPTYKEVCSDRTGHAEVVQVTFDPEVISYDRLVDVFFDNHNPTTLNRQGPDVGTQYRSVIFVHDDEQRVIAERKKAELSKSGRFSKPIVTTLENAPTFYRAEEYHQQYLNKRGLSHCHV